MAREFSGATALTVPGLNAMRANLRGMIEDAIEQLPAVALRVI